MLRKPILIKTRLIQGLQRMQNSGLDLPLVPFNGRKQPLGDGWQQRPFNTAQLIQAIENGGVSVPFRGRLHQLQPKGFGVLNGSVITVQGQSFALMAVDQDGGSAIKKIQSLSNGHLLPVTPTFTSGRDGRCQYLFLVPEELASKVQSRRLSTGVKGEQLEFRFHNLPSILPPSLHPSMGRYHWVDGREIDRIPIAIAPDWVLEQMTIPVKPPLKGIIPRFSASRGDIHQSVDYALSYLQALDPVRADDYDSWVRVGMALHTVDESLLPEWECWSQQSSKYRPGECEQKWRSFSNAKGVKLGTLGFWAKQDGWRSPVKTSGNHASLPRSSIPKPLPAIKSQGFNHSDSTHSSFNTRSQEMAMIPNENKQDALKSGEKVQETVKNTILLSTQLTKKLTRLLLKALERDSDLQEQLPIESQDNHQYEIFLDGKSAFKGQQNPDGISVEQQDLSREDINYIAKAIELPVGEMAEMERDLSIKVNDTEIFRLKDGVVEVNQLEAGLEAEQFEDLPIPPPIPLDDSFQGESALENTPRRKGAQFASVFAKIKQGLGIRQQSLSQAAQDYQAPDKSAKQRKQDLRHLAAATSAQRLLSQFGQEQADGSLSLEGESFLYQQKGEQLTVTANDGRGTVLEFGQGRLDGDLSDADLKRFEQLEVALDNKARQQQIELSQDDDSVIHI